jgi:hypothetical protein
MEVVAMEEVNIAIYNLKGQLINSQILNTGNQIIDLSYLAPQMYIVKLTNIAGISKTLKILKK